MKRLLILLVLAGCAAAPPPVPEDFVERCTDLHRRAGIRYQTLEQFIPGCTQLEVTLENGRRERARRERGAMIVAILFGAASNALAEHNFYVYEVPRARRYLERSH